MARISEIIGCSEHHFPARFLWWHNQQAVRGQWCKHSVVVSPKQHNKQTQATINPLIATLKVQSNGSSYSYTVIGTLTIDGWAVTVDTMKKRAWVQPQPAQAPLHYINCNSLRTSENFCWRLVYCFTFTLHNSPPINGQCTNWYYLMWHYNCLCVQRVKFLTSTDWTIQTQANDELWYLQISNYKKLSWCWQVVHLRHIRGRNATPASFNGLCSLLKVLHCLTSWHHKSM